jgi:VanZ family protein
LKPTVRIFLRNWWPVAVWLGVIRLESTSFASARNTFHLLYRVLFFIFGTIDVRLVLELDHFLRKSGHLIGYAILSGLTYLALRNTYRDRFRPLLKAGWGNSLGHCWRSEWSAIALLLTIVTASLDEIHQSSLPFRTGRWQDVLIDTSGAVVLQVIIYLGCRLRAAWVNKQPMIVSRTPAGQKMPLVEND